MKYDFSKMKKIEKSTQGKFIKYSECTPNQVLVEGEYLGQVTNKFNPSKPNLKFKNNNEEIIILPASGQLNYAFQDTEIGTLVCVTYKGKEKIEKGTFKGKEANAFKIEVYEQDEQGNKNKEEVQLPLNLDALE